MITPETTSSDDAIRFPSLDSFRAAHTELLKAFRTNGSTAEMVARVELFIQRGKATGALLDADADRWTAQSELDYWATQLYQPDYEPPDATLDEFDPQLAPTLDDSLCPYMGLDAFREGNESVFFGRRRLVNELIDKLKTSRFLPVLGSSGSGKSSVVRAGLLPELKKGALPGSADWHYFKPMVPGSNPLTSLAQLVMPPDGNTAQAEFDAEAFREDPEYLAQIVSEGTRKSVVLVVDQFEEIFTLCTDEVARYQFVDNLIALCHLPEAEHRVIITMRSDFEMNITRLPNLQAILEQDAMRITPLTASELRESIEAPAALIGLKFEQGVVDALLNDILGEPSALPLLQFTLLKLWENRERNRVTWETYRKLGGGRQALAHSADDLYNRLIHEEQVTMRRILLKMVRPGEGLEVTSNRVPIANLYQKAEASDRIDRVLEKLIHARLIRVSEGDMAADNQVEVAHEALVRNWPRLVEWLEEERVTLRQRQRLTTAAEEWQRLNGATAALWRRELLEEAIRYDDLNELEKKFVKASNARQQRARRFWVTGILATITFLVVIAITNRQLAQNAFDQQVTAEAASTRAVSQQMTAQAASILAVEQKEIADANAKKALANGLASQAQLIIETRSSNQLTGVLLAIHSLNKSDSVKGAKFILQDFSFSSEAARKTHNNWVNAVAFSPDGKYVVSGSYDGTVQVWEVKTGKEIVSLFHDGSVVAVAFSPDGKKVVSGSDYGTARVWEVFSGKERARMTHEGGVSSIAFSPDGKYVVSGSNDGTARVWEAGTGTEVARIQHGSDGAVESVAFSPDGKYLASGGCDLFEAGEFCSQGTVHIMEVTTEEEVFVGEHDTRVNALTFSPDSKYVASASDDSTVRIWEIDSGTEVARMTHNDWVNAVAFSPDGKYVVSGSADRTARVWEAETGSEVALMTHDDSVYAVAFSPDGKYILSGSGDGTARVWERATGREIARMAHDDWVQAVAFSPDGKYVLSGSYDRTARVWEILKRGDSARMAHNDSVKVVAFSPDGKYVVSGSYDRTARVWEAETGSEVARMTHEDSVYAVAFSPDGKYVVSGSADRTARVWEARTGTEVARMTHEDSVYVVAFSPDGKYILSGSDDGIARVWEWETEREIASMTHYDWVNAAAFSPDGRHVVSGSADRTAQVWETLKGEGVALMTHDDWVTDVTFSPDGKYVLSGSYDRTARVWERATGREIARMIHDDWVQAVAFSPDGKYVVSGSADRTARVWEAETGSEVARMTHEDSVYAVAFSPDGKYILSGSGDGTARVWEWEAKPPTEIIRISHDSSVVSVAFSRDEKYIVSGSSDGTARVRIWQTEGLIESVCAILPRNLTLDEWIQYFDDETYETYEKTCPSLPVHPTVVAKAVEEALSVTTDPNRLQTAINEANDWLNGDSKDARDFVKDTINGKIGELSKQNLNAENLNRYLYLLEDAKNIGLEVNIDPRMLNEIARKALQDHDNPDRVEAATNEIMEILKKFPSSDDPVEQANRIVKDSIDSLIQDSNWETGDITYNLELLKDAKNLGVDIIFADKLNYICWHGSIRGYAKEVLQYCEQAIELAPDNAGFRDSRGLARALLGDYPGAIEDFQFFVDYGGYYEEWVQQRQDWIVTLREGKNPFTPEVLESIKDQ